MCLKCAFCFVVIITILCLGVSKCDSNFFVSKKYEQNQYHCVTNSSFALTWIGKEDEQNSVSRYISAPTKSRIVCDFRTEDYSNCTSSYTKQSKWSLENSLAVNINDIILDQRWEDIATIIVPASDENNLKYRSVISISKDDFEIPFSLRSEKESHIFLCDGPFPPKANCYWFLLEAWNGTRSAIRKCKNGTIPVKKWPTHESCTKLHEYVDHPKFPHYLSDKYWTHFKIVKKKNSLSLLQITEITKNHTILKLTEKKMFTNIKYMITHNKLVNSLWKIHQIELIYTKEEQSSYFGAGRKPANGSICFSMFLSMCQTCKLSLALVPETSKIVKFTSYEVLNSKWTEIKFFADNLQDIEHYLAVYTKGGDSNKFWAIDKVRECEKEEFRIISTTSNTPCQLMSSNNNVISYNPRSSTDMSFENTCPEYTLGEFCVPCTWIYDECEKISICSKDDHNRRTSCFCSAGYHGLDFGCATDCNFGFYGHGCKQRCNNCQTGCSNINGLCSKCIEHYFGLNCNILKATVFANPPSILDFNYTEATIEMNSFELKNMTSGEAAYYFFQIKSGNQSWGNVGSKIPFNKKQGFRIDKLTPETEYSVRAVIETEDKRNYSGDQIPFKNFTTKCGEISEHNIEVEPSNKTVHLVIKQNMHLTCRNTSITLNNKSKHNVSTNNITFGDLEPFTNYTITIQSGSRKSKSINFHTTEGIPTKVTNIFSNNKSSTSISLKWNSPEHIFGHLKCYTIEYQLKSRINCKTKPTNSQITKVNVTGSSATVENLKPHSTYSFRVYAVNGRFNGVPESIDEDTMCLEHISKEEIPVTINSRSESEKVIIELSDVNCSEGPLNVTANLKCLSEWCQNETEITLNEEMPQSSLELKKLFPFTNYTLNLKFCRNNTLCKEKIEGRIIETKPSAPHPVEDLLVYSKTETTISLRWKQPYPPTGILASYKIEYDYPGVIYGKHENQVNTSITQCKLWPKFHCAKLTKLESNKVYTVKVFAKNKDPENYGLSKEIVTTTKTGKSEAPSSLKYSWTMTNDLELEWKHPIRSNGVIRYFDISLASPSIKNPITKKYPVTVLTEETYQRTYHEMINATELLPATKYLISVAAYNGNFGEKAENETDDGPPDLPSFEKIPEFDSTTSTTITVNFQVKKPRDTQKTDYNFFLLVSDDNSTDFSSYTELNNIDLSNERLICKLKIAAFEDELSFTIGNQSETCENLPNPSLKLLTFYNITVILTNKFEDKIRIVLFSKMGRTTEKYVLALIFLIFLLLLLIILIPIGIIVYRKSQSIKNVQKVSETSKANSQISLTTISKKSDQNEINAYENTGNTSNIFSKIIPLKEFPIYVQKSIRNGELRKQHTKILANPMRKIYNTTEGCQYFDYVDVIYSDGIKISKAYIATETPKPNDINDFWKTIWDENVEHIVLFDNNEKFAKYWPEDPSIMSCHGISIQLAFTKTFPDYKSRKFALIYEGEIKQVVQIHFSYSGLNPEKYIPLFKKMSKFQLNPISPICIHSSTGIRGTGFIILCDMSLRMAAKDDAVDVLRNLQRLSDYNADLVDDLEQYTLAHFIISKYYSE